MLSKLFTTFVAVVCAVALAGCGNGDKPAAGPAPDTTVVNSVGGMTSNVPEGATPDSVLAGLIQPPVTTGFVRLRIEEPGVGVMLDGEVFTTYKARVAGFFGPVESPYKSGSVIELRTPGGTTPDGKTTVAEDPFARLQAGETVYVLHRDHGVIGGGNTVDRIVASIKGQDLFYVKDGKVTGDELFASFKEDAAKFEGRFAKR